MKERYKYVRFCRGVPIQMGCIGYGRLIADVYENVTWYYGTPAGIFYVKRVHPK